MPEAPAALSRGSSDQTASASTTEWMAIIPSCASGMIEGDSRPGSRSSSSAAWSRRVHHQVLAIARGQGGAEHRLDRVEHFGAIAQRGPVGEQDRLGREDLLDRPEAVDDHGRAGGDEVHDRLGQAQPGRDFGGARHRDDVDRDGPAVEEAARQAHVRRGDAQAGQVLRGAKGESLGTAIVSRQRP